MTRTLIGSYRREPVELPHHRVKVEEHDEDDKKFVWKPEGESTGWVMTLSPEDDTLLLLGEDCPHYEESKQVTVELEEEKIIGLRFNGELYVRKDIVFEMPDEVTGQVHDGDDDSGGAVVEGEPGFGPEDDASTDM